VSLTGCLFFMKAWMEKMMTKYETSADNTGLSVESGVTPLI